MIDKTYYPEQICTHDINHNEICDICDNENIEEMTITIKVTQTQKKLISWAISVDFEEMFHVRNRLCLPVILDNIVKVHPAAIVDLIIRLDEDLRGICEDQFRLNTENKMEAMRDIRTINIIIKKLNESMTEWNP